MTRPKHSKEREQKIIDAEAGLLKRARTLDRKIYALASQYINTELSLDDKSIKDTSSNYTKISRLDNFLRDNLQEDIDRLVRWYLVQILGISAINEKYFGQFGASRDQVKKAERKVLNSLGVSLDDNGAAIIKPDGLVSQIVDISEASNTIKTRTRAAVGSAVIALPALRQNLKRKIIGDTAQGLMTRKIYNEALETFIRTDLAMGRSIARDVGIRAAIYTGGLIQSSRRFCTERNGKVFTYEEIAAFADLSWPEKPDLYDPFTDPPGGFDCRHGWDHISDDLAIILRPELKDIWGI